MSIKPAFRYRESWNAKDGLERAVVVTKMPRHWIEHVRDWRDEPMAYWVHIEQAGDDWRHADVFEPCAPSVELHRGYPVLCVECYGFEFRFSSRAQLSECVNVLARKPLPTTRRLSSGRAGSDGPNSHWLSRLPGTVKAPRTRQQVVQALTRVMHAMTPESSFWTKG